MKEEQSAREISSLQFSHVGILLFLLNYFDLWTKTDIRSQIGATTGSRRRN
jgi:hypothetical protein